MSTNSNRGETWAKNARFGEFLILLSVIFLGVGFSWQRKAMLNGMGPLSYNAWRFLVSTSGLGLYLLLAKPSITHSQKPLEPAHFREIDASTASESLSPSSQSTQSSLRTLLLWGSLLGIANIGISTAQQMGLVNVSAGKAGFITGMYVIFVPLVEFLLPCFPNLRLHWSSAAAALCSLCGLYLLSGCAEATTESCLGGAVSLGEAQVFLSMLFIAASIVLADVASKELDGVWIVFVEFLLTTIVTVPVAVYFEPEEWVFPFPRARENWDLIVLVGIAEALAFALSTVGQKYSTPTRAALLFSLETVVCALFAFLYLHETLSWIEICGGVLIFCAALTTSLTEIIDEEEEEDDDVGNDRAITNDELTPIIHAVHSKPGFGSV